MLFAAGPRFGPGLPQLYFSDELVKLIVNPVWFRLLLAFSVVELLSSTGMQWWFNVVVIIAMALPRVPGAGQIRRLVKAGDELLGCGLGETFSPGEGVGGLGGRAVEDMVDVVRVAVLELPHFYSNIF